MKNNFVTLSVLFACAVMLTPVKAISQEPVVRQAVYSDVSIPLRDMKPFKNHFWDKWLKKKEMEIPNKFRKVSPVPVADNAIQAIYNNGNRSVSTVPIVNFIGLKNSNNSGGATTPPDPAGDVGPNHYVQVVNCMLQVFSKTGTSMYGPVTTSTIWNGFSGNWSGHNDGDAIVLYDENADRWIISQFAVDCPGSPYSEYEMVAVSTTGDPTGSYYRYAFQFDYMPDYPKLGVWNDGYYLSVNRFNTNTTGSLVGAGACVLERDKMLTGNPSARMVYFKTETLGGSGSAGGYNCWAMLPSDCDGSLPVAGTPNYFVYDDQQSSEIRIWAFHTDWTTTSNCSFTYVTKLPVAAFQELGSVSQQGTSNTLDGLGDRLMFRNQYRDFGTYEAFVTSRSVDAGNGVAGVRWYEFRKTGPTFSLYQQSTYAPGDGKSRWMGSIAMNAIGDIGLAYSVSSSTMFPSIYFTGRKATDPLNQLTIPEGIIQTGTKAMTGETRWGDYSAMNVDPTDNQTFWTTQEFVGTFGGLWPWSTKIASFKFANIPVLATLSVTDITETSVTLNGTVNPNGYATNYNFEWGTTTSYGSTTTSVAVGSGTSDINVNAPLSGLTSGTVYHYRIAAVNSEGTAYGDDVTFIPGGAVVTTTAATAVTLVSASSGGNVNVDGGSAVTARGVCWATTVNPLISDSHTTDGSGTGEFTSTITGLTPNTTYHVRAYAVNAHGTYYGNEVTFVTVCETATLPFSQSFSPPFIPDCWSQVDNAGNGQIWQFGRITGENPSPSLSGNYAYLYSRGYGVGNTQNADLISPTFNFSGYTSVTLQFKHYMRYQSGSTGTLSYSINGGSTWTTIESYTATTNPADFNKVIAAVAGQSAVKFRWNYTGTYGYFWAVDDVKVTGILSGFTLSVSPPSQGVSADAGNAPYQVTSNAAWTASSDSDWCTVTPSGNGNGDITATFVQNVLFTPRTANITVTVAGLTPVVVTLTQAAQVPAIAIEPSNQNVGYAAGTADFTLTSNTSWNAESDQSWCTVNPSGTGNATLTAIYAENVLFEPRIANITLSAVGVTPLTVTVTQEAAVPMLSVTPANQEGSEFSGSVEYTVTSNTDWTASSDSAWCLVTTGGSGNGTITANYSVNPYHSPRIATISVNVAGLTTKTVTLTQAHSTLSLEEFTANGIRLYPNPSKGIFSITVDKSKFPLMDVSVIDAAGVEVLSRICKGESRYNFDLGTSPQGCYFVKIKTADKVMMRELVIIKGE